MKDLCGDEGRAGGEALDVREVVFIDDWVVDEADENWWDEEELRDFVVLYCAEHGFHGEGWKHVDFCVEEDRHVHLVD